DGWLTAVRDPEFAAKLERLQARRAEAAGRPLVLALGSSRMAFGLDAASLSGDGDGQGALVFNFALLGGGPLLNLVVLQRLLAADRLQAGMRAQWPPGAPPAGVRTADNGFDGHGWFACYARPSAAQRQLWLTRAHMRCAGACPDPHLAREPAAALEALLILCR